MSKPTHNLCLKVERENDKAPWVQVGVGWQNEKGQIGIRLNAGVTLSWHDTQVYSLRLFPVSEKENPHDQR